MTVTRWRNWAGNQYARPERVANATDTSEVAQVVARAAQEGLRVKAVGSGHSFTGIAVTGGCLLRTSGLDRLVSADASTGLVTVQAGMSLHRLNELLAEFGLALRNLGDIDSQTVAGAISTGTHGTGTRLGGLATQVEALELVTAAGSVVECSPHTRPELFAAARVGLGALGVITTVTLRCVPAFALHAVERPMRLDRVLADVDVLADGNDHFEFYWFPYTNVALTKRNNRVTDDAAGRPLGRVRGWVDDQLLANSAFDLMTRACASIPRITPAVNNVSARGLTTREYVDASFRVFTTPRRVRFVEMEYAMGRESIVDVLREIRSWIEARREPVPFPVEVRFAAADDIWLSPANGRDTAYVAVHQHPALSWDRYFDAVERIVAGVGGRPHWGKLHGLDAARLEQRYPRFADFVAQRETLDPGHVFENAYLRTVLGAPR